MRGMDHYLELESKFKNATIKLMIENKRVNSQKELKLLGINNL